ncbi:MAG: M56 family metallopeptidase [Candidatus Neomarinimicrobiota bacterium]
MVPLLNHWGEVWLQYFSPLVLQNSMFLGLVFIALHIFRNAPASVKYAIGMVGLVKLLLPPFLPAYLLTSAAVNIRITSDLLAAEPALVQGTGVVDPTTQLNILTFLFLLWASIALVVLLVPMFSLMRLKARLRSARAIETDGETAYPSVKIYRSDHIGMPLTVGLLPDRLFVPTAWDQWSNEHREMVIKHELAHMRRRDGFTNLIQIIVQAVYVFHPLVWLLSRFLDEYREMACDDASVEGDRHSSVAYSRFLVEMAENLARTQHGFATVAGLFKQKNGLLNRVQYQLRQTMQHYSKFKTGLVLTALVLLILPLSWTTGRSFSLGAGKVYGTVRDANTSEALSGANIIIEGTRLGAASDHNGQYFIPNVPEGTYVVKVSMMGYSSLAFSSVEVEEQKSTRLDVKLKPMIIWMEDRKADVSPPPAQPGEEEEMQFVAYDAPPEPVGGYIAIQENVVYPEVARKARIEGTIIVKAFVNAEGQVTKTGILEGIPDSGLNEAALDAVKQVRFTPAMQRDKPIGVWIAIPINFRLSK